MSFDDEGDDGGGEEGGKVHLSGRTLIPAVQRM
jgi:hypothetical protein